MNKTAGINSASLQALRFLVVGASAALVHFLVLISIVNLTAITPVWANVFAFLVAFVVSFLGHFYLTFKSSVSKYGNHQPSGSHKNSNDPLSALGKWFGSSAIGFMVNQGLFVLGLRSFGEQYYILIWLIVTAIITVMTFALGKFWAFKS